MIKKKPEMSLEQIRGAIFALLIERRRQAEEAREQSKQQTTNVESVAEFSPTLTFHQITQMVWGTCDSLGVYKPAMADFLIALDELEKKYQTIERVDKEFMDGDTRYQARVLNALTATTDVICADGFRRTAITLQQGNNRSVAVLNERGEHVITLNLFEFEAYYDVDVIAKEKDARTTVLHIYEGSRILHQLLPGKVIANFVTKPEHNTVLTLPKTDRVKAVEEWLREMRLERWAADEHRRGDISKVIETVRRYHSTEIDQIGLEVTVRDAVQNIFLATERAKGFQFGNHTARHLAQQTPTEGNIYEENIVEAARFLCGEGEGDAKYDTQYSSGTTVWHTSADKPKMVRRSGGWAS